MVQRENIIISKAEKACQKISRKVTGELRKMTSGMQSGDDSPLKNIWDEVCVQVQGQESSLWVYYLNVIGELIRVELKLIDPETEQTVWLQTDQGADWDMDIEMKIQNEEEVPEKIEASEDNIIEFILNEYILKTAADYKNKRIEKFLDQDMDLDE